MSEPFHRSGQRIRVRLTDEEREVLATLLGLVADAGDATRRLDYRAHPDDPAAEDRYRELVGDSLDSLRHADRRRFGDTVGDASIDAETAESWIRVVGEARLILAERLGIDDDAWEEHHDPTASPDAALISYLGYLQDALVRALA